MMRPVLLLASVFAASSVVAQTRTILQATNDLAFNPSQNLLYASVPSTSAKFPNTVIQIDPATGAVLKSLFVGSEPKRLALSKDGSTLYVGLDGSGMVRQIATSTFTNVRAWNLPVHSFFGATYVEDLSVSPDDPLTVAVSMQYQGVSPRHAGVALYRAGVKAEVDTPDHTGSNCIGFGMDGAYLYGYNNESTEYGFRQMQVGKSGLTITRVDPANAQFYTKFRIDKARAYFTNGIIWDYKKGKLLGTVALPSAAQDVAASTARNRIAYLVNTQSGLKIFIYNLTTMTLVRICGTNGVGEGGSLHRYGARGILFRSPGKIHLLPVVTGL